MQPCPLTCLPEEEKYQSTIIPVHISETRGKLRYYEAFKPDPTPARYVLMPLGPGQRWALASLRAGCFPLAVETEQYRSPRLPVTERLCVLCKDNSIEDELHFLIYCKSLHKERYALISKLANLYPECFPSHLMIK